MKHGRKARTVLVMLMATALLSGAAATSAWAQDADAEHPVVGRWNVEAEPGGSVWAFRPSGLLVVSGPDEIMSEGTWVPAAGEGAFDASVAVDVTGQSLTVLGQVADDGSVIALYINATEATRPDDWTPWPTESRVVAPRFGMDAGESPMPSPRPIECLRPEWNVAGLDWDRCDDGLTDPAAVEPS